MPNIEKLLGEGKGLGMEFSYKAQPSLDGLLQAFILGESLLAKMTSAYFWDNVFYGQGFGELLKRAVIKTQQKIKLPYLAIMFRI